MKAADPSWEERVASLWKAIDEYALEAFIGEMNALADELPPESAMSLFEPGSAQDSAGHPESTAPLYQAALAAGLSGLRRRRTVIQMAMASSPRDPGRPAREAELLTEELHATSDELDEAVRAFLALALVDLGPEREAVAVSLASLSRYLSRYDRSFARCAEQIRRHA
jgi:hypothetical protein